MDGFRIFQLHIALKLHFTRAEFSIFKNKGYLRGTYETFLKRKDYLLYDKLAKIYNTPQEVIPFIAANLMYNNFPLVYDLEESIHNYTEYLRRKQSITKVFTDDMYTLLNRKVSLKSAGQSSESVLDLFLGKKITIETFRILDDIINLISNLKENDNKMLLFKDELIRVEKSKGFVHYKKEKIMPIYFSYLNEEF